MPLRCAKILLLGSVSLLLAVIAFNNVFDYWSNFDFVAHVMSMDTTFRHESVMWRAIETPLAHHAAYWFIIGWELVAATGCSIGTVRLIRAVRGNSMAFAAAQQTAIVAVTIGMALWLTAFLVVGGEWFLMWQSAQWNGQSSAFRMFVILAITLVVIVQPDADSGIRDKD